MSFKRPFVASLLHLMRIEVGAACSLCGPGAATQGREVSASFTELAVTEKNGVNGSRRLSRPARCRVDRKKCSFVSACLNVGSSCRTRHRAFCCISLAVERQTFYEDTIFTVVPRVVQR